MGILSLMGAGPGHAGSTSSGATIVATTLHAAAGGTAGFTYDVTGAAVGDAIVVHLQNPSTPTATITSGALTQLDTHTHSGGDADWLFSGVLAAGDLTTHTLTLTNMTATEPVIVVIVRGGTGTITPSQYQAITAPTFGITFPSIGSGAAAGVLMTVIGNNTPVGPSIANTPGTWTFTANQTPIPSNSYFAATVAINGSYSAASVTSQTYAGYGQSGWLSGIS